MPEDITSEITNRIDKFKGNLQLKLRTQKRNVYNRGNLIDPLVRTTLYDYLVAGKVRGLVGCRFLRRERRKEEKGGKLPECLMKHLVSEFELYKKLRDTKGHAEPTTKTAKDIIDSAKRDELDAEYLINFAGEYDILSDLYRRLVFIGISEHEKHRTLRQEFSREQDIQEIDEELEEAMEEYLEHHKEFVDLFEEDEKGKDKKKGKKKEGKKAEGENVDGLLDEDWLEEGEAGEKSEVYAQFRKELKEFKKEEVRIASLIDQFKDIPDKTGFFEVGLGAQKKFVLQSLYYICPHAYYTFPYIEKLLGHDVKRFSLISRQLRHQFHVDYSDIYNKRPCKYIFAHHWWNGFWQIEAEEIETDDAAESAAAGTGKEVGELHEDIKRENLLTIITKFITEEIDAAGLEKRKKELAEGMDNLLTTVLVEAIAIIYKENAKAIAKEYKIEKSQVVNRAHLLLLEAIFHELAILMIYAEQTYKIIKKASIKEEEEIKGILTGKDLKLEKLKAAIDKGEDDPKKFEKFGLEPIDAERLAQIQSLKKIKHLLIEGFETIANMSVFKTKAAERKRERDTTKVIKSELRTHRKKVEGAEKQAQTQEQAPEEPWPEAPQELE